MRLIPDSFVWLAYRRFMIARRLQGFQAHARSYATKDCQFSEYCRLWPFSRLGNSSLGKATYITGARVVNSDIGAFCSIGHGAFVGGLGIHPTSWISTHPAFYSLGQQAGLVLAQENQFEELKRTQVGNDVWIGANVVILDGVDIGNGAVIAAGAVVNKDVDPYSIVGGVPARVIRKRFSEEVIERLNEWSWWRLPDANLRQIAPGFIAKTSWEIEDIDALIDRAYQWQK